MAAQILKRTSEMSSAAASPPLHTASSTTSERQACLESDLKPPATDVALKSDDRLRFFKKMSN